MPLRQDLLVLLCIGFASAGTHLARAQEATSANLPDQFQTGEMASTSRPKKKKTESSSQTLATAPRQTIAPVPEQAPAVEQSPPPIRPGEDKKAEPSTQSALKTPSRKPTTVTEEQSPVETSAITVAPVEKKPRPKKRPRPAIQPEPASNPVPVPMSLSVAQSMAVRAPLPEYPYEAKRRDVIGSGVCVITVDPGTGKVTDATMERSTGDHILDKVTTETFRTWRFKPGTVSQVRLPISYE
jgi:TonB family protein